VAVSGTQARIDGDTVPVVESDRPTRQRPPAFRTRLPALYKAMIITSFVINMLLLVVLLALGGLLYQQRRQIQALTLTTQTFARENIVELTSIVDGLQTATIRTNIPLNQQLPLNLTVPIDQNTVVTTVEPVPISVPASIDMGPFGQLYPNVNLSLPAGTPLNIQLKIDVPLQTSVPVQLDVPVEIPLKDTELGPLFGRLGALLDTLLAPATPLLGLPEGPAATP
jgi:multisubunit Na+/H+ antiporter MnhC subunit